MGYRHQVGFLREKKKKHKNHTRHEAGPGEGKRSEALVGAK